MSTAFESIKQGLQEAITHAKDDERGVRVHRPRFVDVKAVRAKVGTTQEQFAARFGFSTATLRHWERGDRTPRVRRWSCSMSLNAIRRQSLMPWLDFECRARAAGGYGMGPAQGFATILMT